MYNRAQLLLLLLFLLLRRCSALSFYLSTSMCGIGVTVGSGCNVPIVIGHEMLRRRGPDANQVLQLMPPNVQVEATVLHMRGSSITLQPVSLPQGLFCWNGEVYQMKMNNDEKIQELDTADASDTQILSDILDEALQQDNNDSSSTLEILTSVMSRVVNGEFAFCFVTEKSVFYGRDQWGRRSLLLSLSSSSKKEDYAAWRLSSVATDCSSLSWTEVTPGCVYQYHLETGVTASLPLTTTTTMNAVVADVPSSTTTTTTTMERPSHVSESMWLASLQLQELLQNAVRQRCCNHVVEEGIGVMFSGGLDSVVLTALAAQVLPPHLSIDLLNVSFAETSADQKAALQSHHELQELYPSRQFRLVLVEADWDQVVQYEKRMEQLMHPKTTTMDLNISTALWFAARGKGTLFDNDNSGSSRQPYESACRILLMGMGADELMGGYGRHRKCFVEDGGYDRLRQELDMDLGRLWERNLGRDDRLVSDHGKEARFPYLDTNVVSFLTSLPLQDVCDFTQEPGVGDKMILRLIAQRLGLKTASGLVKRAIQFGSRIAHVNDKKRFGSRRKATGQSHFRGTVTVEPPSINGIDNK